LVLNYFKFKTALEFQNNGYENIYRALIKEIASQRTEAANRDYLDTLKELGENLGKFAYKKISACKMNN